MRGVHASPDELAPQAPTGRRAFGAELLRPHYLHGSAITAHFMLAIPVSVRWRQTYGNQATETLSCQIAARRHLKPPIKELPQHPAEPRPRRRPVELRPHPVVLVDELLDA